MCAGVINCLLLELMI